SLPNVGENIFLLQYADDALFFGAWSESNAKNLIRILKCFQDVSGLSINLSKSISFGVCVDEPKVVRVENVVRYRHDNLPFMYLGLPMGKDMSKAASCDLVIERGFRPQLGGLLLGGDLVMSLTHCIPLPFLALSILGSQTVGNGRSVREKILWCPKKNISWDNWILMPDVFGIG
nr:arginine repressor C-terminal-like domain-containing protein [Tanacetum cinerariifolium]